MIPPSTPGMLRNRLPRFRSLPIQSHGSCYLSCFRSLAATLLSQAAQSHTIKAAERGFGVALWTETVSTVVQAHGVGTRRQTSSLGRMVENDASDQARGGCRSHEVHRLACNREYGSLIERKSATLSWVWVFRTPPEYALKIPRHDDGRWQQYHWTKADSPLRCCTDTRGQKKWSIGIKAVEML